jgi:hypothetical protein
VVQVVVAVGQVLLLLGLAHLVRVTLAVLERPIMVVAVVVLLLLVQTQVVAAVAMVETVFRQALLALLLLVAEVEVEVETLLLLVLVVLVVEAMASKVMALQRLEQPTRVVEVEVLGRLPPKVLVLLAVLVW